MVHAVNMYRSRCRGPFNSKYYIKKLQKQDSDACNKLDTNGYTKQTATDADLHSSSLPDSQETPSTSGESCMITDTLSITDQANEVTTETTGTTLRSLIA